MKVKVKATGEIITLRPRPPRCSRIDHDYWTRLEHTYAGMAMQAILTNLGNTVDPDYIVEEAEAYATALVEKLKND